MQYSFSSASNKKKKTQDFPWKSTGREDNWLIDYDEVILLFLQCTGLHMSHCTCHTLYCIYQVVQFLSGYLGWKSFCLSRIHPDKNWATWYMIYNAMRHVHIWTLEKQNNYLPNTWHNKGEQMHQGKIQSSICILKIKILFLKTATSTFWIEGTIGLKEDKRGHLC